MFSRDERNLTVTMKDDSAVKLYDINDFVRRMNQTTFLVDEDSQGSPAALYLNSQLGSRDDYNDYINATKQMTKQLSSLVGKLKMAHLPVTLPDAEYFARSFKSMLSSNLSGSELDEAIKKDAIAFKKAIDISVKANNATALKNRIAIDERETTK